jgi:hypothetical protein
LGDFSKRKKSRKTGPSTWGRRCRCWSRHLSGRPLGWQAPEYVDQLGRLLLQTVQSSYVVLDSKHNFIASAIQLVNRPDQFIAFAGQALTLTREPLRLFVWRRAGFCRRLFSSSRHRSSLHRVVSTRLSRNRGGRAVKLSFRGELTSNRLNSPAQRTSDHTARLCSGLGRERNGVVDIRYKSLQT